MWSRWRVQDGTAAPVESTVTAMIEVRFFIQKASASAAAIPVYPAIQLSSLVA
jgi:hypothetical protein